MEIESLKIKDNIKNLIHLNQSFQQESILFLINSKRKLYIYTSSNLNDVLERVNEYEFNKSISPKDIDNIEIKNFFEIMTNSKLEDRSVNNMINQTFQSIKERNNQRKKKKRILMDDDKRLLMLRQKRKVRFLKKGIFNEKYDCNNDNDFNILPHKDNIDTNKIGNISSQSNNKNNINVIEYKDKDKDKDNNNLNKNNDNDHNDNHNHNDNKYNTIQLKEIISKQNLYNNEKEDNLTIEKKENNTQINKIGNISKLKKLHVDTNFKINDIPSLNLKQKHKPFPQVPPPIPQAQTINTINTLSTIQFDNKNDNLFSEKSNFSNLISVNKENQVNNKENQVNNMKDKKKIYINTNKDDINIFNSIDNQIKRNQIGVKKEIPIKQSIINNHKSISPRGELMNIFNNKSEVNIDNIQSELSYIDNIIDKNSKQNNINNNIQNNNISHTKQLTESSLYVKNNNNYTNQMTTGGIFSKNSNFLFFYNNFEINDNNSDSESDYRLD